MTASVRSSPLIISRRARLAAAPGALLGLCLALACGACGSSLATRQAEVRVTTPEGAPIPGATVRADPIDPHHPLNIGDYFKGDPGTLGIWRTDSQGHTTITLLSDRPTAVSFMAAGFTPDSMLIDATNVPPFRLTLTPVAEVQRNPR